MGQRDWHWGRFCEHNHFASVHPHPRRRKTTGPRHSVDGNRFRALPSLLRVLGIWHLETHHNRCNDAHRPAAHPDAAHTRMDRDPRRVLLPSLACVGLWSTGITTSASTRFFNRHTGIRTLKYMAGAQVVHEHAEEEVCMPNLESLNTVLGYLLYALADTDTDSSSSDYRFPRLAYIELRPTPHTLLRPALRVLASQTAAPPVAALTLWSLPTDELQDGTNELWTDIVLPGVRVLVLNECKLPVDLTSFPTLLARVFPALVKLELNYCALGRSASIIKRQTERDSMQAFAEEVRRVFASERRRQGGVDRTVNLKLVVDGREV
ncbi:hypothetical protein C8F01DRAFT_1126398 [Mycena amicta]|nr:hypothetical protein C8F01DRAFT_1126398 [Mycena amicta]